MLELLVVCAAAFAGLTLWLNLEATRRYEEERKLFDRWFNGE